MHSGMCSAGNRLCGYSIRNGAVQDCSTNSPNQPSIWGRSGHTSFSGISHIQNVTGASDGAPGSYNILVGNGGNVLTGGSGRRNLLVAGATASQLYGSGDDDILIGGTTAYDTEANMASLQAIMAYWTGADDFATRVNNLTTGNGVPLLDATMVQSNGGGNTLQGGGGLDLFFGSLGLDIHDKQDGEVFIEV